MNYLKHLQDIFGNQMKITEELNYKYNGVGTLCIIKYLQGSNYRESIIQPIQLAIYTDDVPSTKAILDTFTKTYTNTPYTDGLEYINQIYSTPMVLSNFNQVGTNYISQFIVSVTLIISSNISDVKQVYIDGELYETTLRNVSYVAGPDSQRKNSATYLNETLIQNGLLRMSFNLISKSDALGTKLRGIRQGTISINTPFTVKMVYTDNGIEEEYVMKCESFIIQSENQLLPSISITFIK